jgi:hypothetical protein
MKSAKALRSYYVLPCCLLMLNLCVELVSYKARGLGDPLVQVIAIMAMVLFGGSMVAFVVSPAIEVFVGWVQRKSRSTAGSFGEVLFLFVLGGLVFWLYYRVYILGPETVLPSAWHNHKAH